MGVDSCGVSLNCPSQPLILNICTVGGGEPPGSSTCLSEVGPLQADRPLRIIALLLLSSHSMTPLGPPPGLLSSLKH